MLMKFPQAMAKAVITFLRWYPSLLGTWNGTNIVTAIGGKPTRKLHVNTDGGTGKDGDPHPSGGAGAWVRGIAAAATAWPIPLEDLKVKLSSTLLEWWAMTAIIIKLHRTGLLRGAEVTIQTDSKPAADGYDSGNSNETLYPFLLIIVKYVTINSAALNIRHVSRDENGTADSLARGLIPSHLFPIHVWHLPLKSALREFYELHRL